jgi:hypothetical protein
MLPSSTVNKPFDGTFKSAKRAAACFFRWRVSTAAHQLAVEIIDLKAASSNAPQPARFHMLRIFPGAKAQGQPCRKGGVRQVPAKDKQEKKDIPSCPLSN